MSFIAERIKALDETRNRVWEEAKAHLEAVGSREMNVEENEKYHRLSARLDELAAEMRKLYEDDQREREVATLREQSLSALGEQRVERNERAAVNEFRAWLNGDDSFATRDWDGKAAFEVDIQRALKERRLLRQGASAEEIRALAWDASSGSLTVPTTLARTVANVLEANIAAFRIGATDVNTATGENMNTPTIKTHAVATQVASQNLAIGGTDPVFARPALNVFKYGELVQISSEWMTDSVFDVSELIGREIGYGIARVVDADLVVGSGTSEPTGMTVLAGAGTNAPVTTGGSLIAPTVEKYIDLVYSVNDGARGTGAAAWLMKDSTAGTIRKLRDGAGGTVGAFLWQPSLTQGVITGQPGNFLGYPVYTDPNCAAAGSNATLATFGDFSQYYIRHVGNPMIERSDHYGFNADSVYFRGKWRAGGNHSQVSHLNNLVQNV